MRIGCLPQEEIFDLCVDYCILICVLSTKIMLLYRTAGIGGTALHGEASIQEGIAETSRNIAQGPEPVHHEV
jgi:hypothetical protein